MTTHSAETEAEQIGPASQSPQEGPPPAQPLESPGPDDEDIEEITPPTKKGGRFGRRSKGAPKPSRKQAKADKADARGKKKEQSKAARKRALDARRRAQKSGFRYRGGRGKLALLGLIILLSGALSLAAFLTALSRPSQGDVETAVSDALTEAGQDFPRGQAVMWAGQVLRVWGTWDEASPESRELALSPYLSSGMPASAGWNGRGSQQVIYSSVNPDPVVQDATHATVSAVYQVNDGTWRCVDMPLVTFKPEEFTANAKHAFALAGNPTPVPCAPRTGVAPLANADDPLTAGGLRANGDIGRTLATDFFPSFFAAWAASDEAALTQFTASGVRTIGLGGAMASLPQPDIGETTVYVDADGVVEGKVYSAVVPVTWTVAGTDSQITATYVVPVRQDGQRWTVAGEPVAAMQSPEAEGRSPGSIPQPGQGVTSPEYSTPDIEPSAPAETANPDSVEEAPEETSDAETSDEAEPTSSEEEPEPSETEASESEEPTESESASEDS